MPITTDELKERQQDYFIAAWENDELAMEPHCRCGKALDEDYHCGSCNRQCECTFILCKDHQTLAVVRKFIHGSPRFQNFGTAVMASG